jgi:glutathione S-transferase
VAGQREHMIDFYDNDMSVCAQKVRLVLAEKGIEYRRHHLNLRAGDQFKPEYRKLNPKAVVPTIVHDGQPVTESTVIIAYLEDVFPDPSLTPRTPIERARMLQWMVLPDSGLHDACGLTSFALAFRKQLAHLEPTALEAHVARMPDETRRAHVRALVAHGLDAPGVGSALRTYRRALTSMAAALSESEWLAGDQYSLADVTMVPYVLRLEHLGLGWFWNELPRVGEWLNTAGSRPAFHAIRTHLDPKYLAVMSGSVDEHRARIESLLQENKQ